MPIDVATASIGPQLPFGPASEMAGGIGDGRSADGKGPVEARRFETWSLLMAVRTYKSLNGSCIAGNAQQDSSSSLVHPKSTTILTSSPWTMSQVVDLDHAMFWTPPTRLATKRASRMLAQTERSQSNSSFLQADEFQAGSLAAPGQAPDGAISIYSDTESVLDEACDSDADREGDDNSRLHGSLEDDTLPSLGALLASLAETRPDLATSSDMPSQIRTGTSGSDATTVAERTAARGVLAGEGDHSLLERPRRDSSQGQQDGTNACPAATSSPTEPASILLSK